MTLKFRDAQTDMPTESCYVVIAVRSPSNSGPMYFLHTAWFDHMNSNYYYIDIDGNKSNKIFIPEVYALLEDMQPAEDVVLDHKIRKEDIPVIVRALDSHHDALVEAKHLVALSLRIPLDEEQSKTSDIKRRILS